MMAATGMSFSVQGVPHGPAPIHWYANAEAIYLFCSDASWTSALASLREELAKEQSSLASDSPIDLPEPMSFGMQQPAIAAFPTTIQQAPSSFSSGPLASTPATPPRPISASPEAAPAPRFRGTLEFDSFVTPSPQSFATPPAALPSPEPPVTAGPTNYRGTLILNGAGSDSGAAASGQPEMPTSRGPAQWIEIPHRSLTPQVSNLRTHKERASLSWYPTNTRPLACRNSLTWGVWFGNRDNLFVRSTAY